MSRKKRKRNRKKRNVKRRAPANEYLVTIGSDAADGPCDCPICRIMGIDLEQVDGVDVRPITPEQRVLLEAFYASGGERN